MIISIIIQKINCLVYEILKIVNNACSNILKPEVSADVFFCPNSPKPENTFFSTSWSKLKQGNVAIFAWEWL